MAATTTSFPIAASAPAAALRRVGTSRRRRLDVQAGRALEILGHAIEYLTDELVHEGGSLSADDARVQAVQLLMALNRQVYYACPEEPTLAERCSSLLGLRGA